MPVVTAEAVVIYDIYIHISDIHIYIYIRM